MEWWETLLEVPLCQLGVWLRSITYHKGRGCYISGTEIEFSGASGLGRVDMDETITASGSTMLAKAWLLNVPEGVFTVVLCCGTDRLEEDLPVLEAMAGTLTLTM